MFVWCSAAWPRDQPATWPPDLFRALPSRHPTGTACDQKPQQDFQSTCAQQKTRKARQGAKRHSSTFARLKAGLAALRGFRPSPGVYIVFSVRLARSEQPLGTTQHSAFVSKVGLGWMPGPVIPSFRFGTTGAFRSPGTKPGAQLRPTPNGSTLEMHFELNCWLGCERVHHVV